jgi:hypothetical protein
LEFPRWLHADTSHKFYALALFGFLLVAMLWVAMQGYSVSEQRIVSGDPQAFSGDEPHYLVVVNSLLFDGDVALANNYASGYRGGLDAGARWAGRGLDHHTLLVDSQTRARADWQEIFDWEKYLHCRPHPRCLEASRRDERFSNLDDVIERSAHPIAFPAILAAALAPTHPQIEDVETRIAIFMVLVSWLGVVLTYVAARAFEMSPHSSIAAAALLGVASPWLVYSRAFYPGTVTGVALLVALISTLRGRTVLAAVGVSAAAALKPAFALVAIAWFLLEFLRGQPRRATIFAAVVSVCGAAIAGINYWLTGTPWVFGAGNIKGFSSGMEVFDTLIDWRSGLFLFTPWSILAFVGLAISLRPSSRARPIEPMAWMSVGAVPIAVLLIAYDSRGGACWGPRYWVPLLPWLAIAGVAAAERFGRAGKIALATLAVTSALIAIPGVLLYPSFWNQPPQAALAFIADWFSR